MAPSNTPKLDEHHVRQSVLLYSALARRWLATRDAAVGRLIAPIVAAAKDDARENDESFVTELHDDLTALYRDFQHGDPNTADERGRELRRLFEAYALGLSDEDLIALDMTPDEIAEATGPADAARSALAEVLKISARTIHSYRQRLGLVRRPQRTLDELLADSSPSLEARTSPSVVYRWRETLRAARAIEFIVVNFFGGTSRAARDALHVASHGHCRACAPKDERRPRGLNGSSP